MSPTLFDSSSSGRRITTGAIRDGTRCSHFRFRAPGDSGNFTACLGFQANYWLMDVLTAVKALNQRAAREKWYQYCDPSLAFCESVHSTLLNLWRSKAGGRPMPRRSEMTLRDLKEVLRHLIVLERVEKNPSRYRVRLLGTSLTSMAGDRTGKMLDEVIPPDHLPRWVVCADLVLDGGQPLRFVGRVHLEGKEYLNAENLYVPLANDSDEPTFVMALCRYTPRHTESEESWESQVAAMAAAAL